MKLLGIFLVASFAFVLSFGEEMIEGENPLEDQRAELTSCFPVGHECDGDASNCNCCGDDVYCGCGWGRWNCKCKVADQSYAYGICKDKVNCPNRHLWPAKVCKKPCRRNCGG
uniref:Mu-ctenitoxin-Pn1a n=1 Tax=Phoneutria nigriventer TaxID=6918 RepID=TXL1_PHONI|nr:RecName: Full=Mu-ctenitoxin-Pn1a; Short=Mu-CNTX-Pn1a; AltName: Full=Toxin Tx1; Short=PNTx1; Short=PhTx1; Flags: Precursor [Phoneutria nigriventer]